MAYVSQKQRDLRPYGVGNRVYGGGRSFPNIGPSDPTGYRERDLKAAARRSAVLRRMKAKNRGHFMSSDALRGV